MYTTRKSCRICAGDLKDVISLGEIHLSTFLDTNDNPPPKIPLDLVQCVDCDLVQLRHTTSGNAMYSDYWYQSGLNGSMVRALNDVVENVFRRAKLNKDDIVIDIGANDGTLLNFYPNYLYKVAFEPSNLYTLAVDKADKVFNDYFHRDRFVTFFGDTKAKVITAIAMFYDLEDPHSFVQDLHDLIADDGLIVIQMMDLLSMVKLNDFPNICHEHLEYYSLAVFKRLMEGHNLEIFDIEYNGVNGGSMRAYIAKKGMRPVLSSVQTALDTEKAYFDQINLPEYFKTQIESVREKVVSTIRALNKEGCSIAVMGASTKGNTILQYFGLNDQDITHAAEVNPDKYGRQTVGSNIPIIAQNESLALNPDYYLILPWGFIQNFIERNIDYLQSGGKFIVPLPTPRIVSYENGKLCEHSL